MGEWMMIPEAEQVIATRIRRYRYQRTITRRYAIAEVPMDLFVQFDINDIANLNDVAEAWPPWQCEIPSTDDGF